MLLGVQGAQDGQNAGGKALEICRGSSSARVFIMLMLVNEIQ